MSSEQANDSSHCRVWMENIWIASALSFDFTPILLDWAEVEWRYNVATPCVFTYHATVIILLSTNPVRLEFNRNSGTTSCEALEILVTDPWYDFGLLLQLQGMYLKISGVSEKGTLLTDGRMAQTPVLDWLRGNLTGYGPCARAARRRQSRIFRHICAEAGCVMCSPAQLRARYSPTLTTEISMLPQAYIHSLQPNVYNDPKRLHYKTRQTYVCVSRTIRWPSNGLPSCRSGKSRKLQS